ncbi:MAG: hypothetical protein PVG91_12050 [Gammaproteobacteria bacterium]|jgi:photosystem II stability/assembly factor-like uncharacterized protein
MFRRIPGFSLTRALSLLALALTAGPGWSQDDADAAFIAPLASSNVLLLDVVNIDGHIVAVGERGVILISDDQGRSWMQSKVPSRAVLTGVFFHDRNLGWAVGHDSIVLKTTDGGESWKVTHFAPELELPLFDVWFADADNGMAVGAYGFVIVTDDGGETWEESALDALEFGAVIEDRAVEDTGSPEDDSEDDAFWEDEDLPADYHLNVIVDDGTGHMLIAAEAGNIYRSDDGGDSWMLMPSFYLGSFFGATATEDGEVYVTGLRGHLFRSRDGGESWEDLDTGVETSLNGAVALPGDGLAVVGMSGTLLISRDGGSSFELVQQENRKALMNVMPVGDGGLLLFGEAGVTRLEPGEF